VSLGEQFRTFRMIIQLLSSRVNESNDTSAQYNFFSKRGDLKRHILEDVNPSSSSAVRASNVATCDSLGGSRRFGRTCCLQIYGRVLSLFFYLHICKNIH